MEHAHRLLEDIDLFQLSAAPSVFPQTSRAENLLDLCSETESNEERPLIAEEWQQFENACVEKASIDAALTKPAKTVSFSEYSDLALYSADDLIRRVSISTSKQRSFSHDEKTNSNSVKCVQLASLAVPPKLEHKKPSLTQISAINSDHQHNSMSNGHYRGLNGYIKHENVAALLDLEGESSDMLTSPSNHNQQATNQPLIALASETMDECTESEQSEDDVFMGLSGDKKEDLMFRKPLINAKKKAAAIVRGAVVGDIDMTVKDLQEDDQFAPVHVRKGRSWRDRLFCFTCVICANLLLALVVASIVFFSGALTHLPTWFNKNQVLLPTFCASTNAQYMLNRTSDADMAMSNLEARIIKGTTSQGWLYLLPYVRFNCYNCDGVAAYYTGSLQRAWDYLPKCFERYDRPEAEAQLVKLSCGADIDLDGVQDCATVCTYVNSRGGRATYVEMFSGATGVHITGWDPSTYDQYPYGLDWHCFLPVWLPDMNNDNIPEMILTCFARDNDEPPTSYFHMMSSVARSKTSRADLFRLVHQWSRKHMGPAICSAQAWSSGDGGHFIVSAFAGQPGLTVWDPWDLWRGQSGNAQKLLEKEIKLEHILGLSDINGDGFNELIACTEDKIIVINGKRQTVMWILSIKGFACQMNSVAFGHLNLDKFMDIAVSLSKDHGIYELNMIDGNTSKSIGPTKTFESVLTAPVIGKVSGQLGVDRVFFWQKNSSHIRLISSGYPWKNVSLIYHSPLYKVADSNELFEESMNKRGVPVLYAENGQVFLLFATNHYEYNKQQDTENYAILLHRVKVSCIGGEGRSASFSNLQPWSQASGSYGDNVMYT